MQIRYVHFVYVLVMCDITTPTLCSMQQETKEAQAQQLSRQTKPKIAQQRRKPTSKQFKTPQEEQSEKDRFLWDAISYDNSNIDDVRKALALGANVNSIAPMAIQSAALNFRETPAGGGRLPGLANFMVQATPVSHLAYFGNRFDNIAILRELLKAGGNPNYQDLTDDHAFYNDTPLIIAIIGASTYGFETLPAIRLLLDYGAQKTINTPDRDGRTPIIHATNGCFLDDIMRLLLQYGADPYQKDNEDHDAFYYANECLASESISDIVALKILQEWQREEQAKVALQIQQTPNIRAPIPKGVAGLIAEYVVGPELEEKKADAERKAASSGNAGAAGEQKKEAEFVGEEVD